MTRSDVKDWVEKANKILKANKFNGIDKFNISVEYEEKPDIKGRIIVELPPEVTRDQLYFKYDHFINHLCWWYVTVSNLVSPEVASLKLLEFKKCLDFIKRL